MSITNSDSFFTSADFQTFFHGSPRSLVMKADAPQFTILAVSDHYLKLVHKQRHELLGKGLFEVFPGSAGDLSEQNSVHSSFLRVINTGKADDLPIFKYEIVIDNEAGNKETHYWTNLNEPLLDVDSKVAYIINSTTNITDRVKLEQALQEGQKREQALNEELADSNQELTAINEELAAANEELQTTNLELGKSNSALQTAVEQLSAAREAAQLGLFD